MKLDLSKGLKEDCFCTCVCVCVCVCVCISAEIFYDWSEEMRKILERVTCAADKSLSLHKKTNI